MCFEFFIYVLQNHFWEKTYALRPYDQFAPGLAPRSLICVRKRRIQILAEFRKTLDRGSLKRETYRKNTRTQSEILLVCFGVRHFWKYFEARRGLES